MGPIEWIHEFVRGRAREVNVRRRPFVVATRCVECEPCHRPRFSDEEAVPRPLRVLRPEGYRLRHH